MTDDVTHKTLWSFGFSNVGMTILLITLVVLSLGAVYCLVAFTPIKTFIPGYPDPAMRREYVNNAIRIDSLETVVARWELYSENLRAVISGERPSSPDSVIARSGRLAEEKMALLRSRDSLLRQNITEEEQFEISRRKTGPGVIEGIHFYTPLKGVVTKKFDKVVHPSIDVSAKANSVVSSVLDGTVVATFWDDYYGNVIAIQHENNIISIYKHNQKLLKKVGDRVSAGSAIALVGSETTDHLHLELWYQGEAVDPALYINF